MLNYKKNKKPSLSREQEKELFRKYQSTNDPKIKNEIVEYYSGLVFFYAKKIAHKKYQYEDIVQEGFLGLNYAIERYNTTFHCRFTFYAGYWIKAQMYSYVYDNYIMADVPASASFLKGFWKIRRYSGLPKEEISSKLNLSIENIEILQNILTSPETSLDAPRPKDGSENSYDRVSFQKALNNISVTNFEESFIENQEKHYKLMVVNNQLKNLKDQERDIILDYYMGSKTMQQIGKKYDITRQRVEQIQKIAINKIKENIQRIG